MLKIINGEIVNYEDGIDKPINYLYVAKNGLDTYDGSASKPFLTIQKAIDTATSGTTIFIFSGSYNENITFKAGVMLTSPVKFGVTITGNHVVNYSGTVVCENITFNSVSGITLSFNGTGIQNLQLIGSSINSVNGDAINYTNTNASSRIYFEDGTCNVSTSGTTARCFYSLNTAKGKLIANRVSFTVNNPDNVTLNINGAISFAHTSDTIVGQVLVNDTSTAMISLVSMTTGTVPVLVTNSSGLSVLSSDIINTTSNPSVSGLGGLSYMGIGFSSTGKNFASTLNGGIGGISVPMASFKLKDSTLIPNEQLATGYNSGNFEFDGTDLYFTKGTIRDKVAIGSVSGNTTWNTFNL